MTNDLSILQHALGLDQHGRLVERRNHFVADVDGCNWAECMTLVESGFMTRHGPSAIYGGSNSYCFVVTEAGRAYVREHSTPPPKKTRGQVRYETWLRVSDACGMSFGEWIKTQGGTP